MRALLLALLLTVTGCASTGSKHIKFLETLPDGSPAPKFVRTDDVFGDMDPCMVVLATGQEICLTNATPERLAAWRSWAYDKTVDEYELHYLTWWKWGSVGDIGTTTVAMAVCKGVAKEANPLWAGLGPVGFVVGNGAMTVGIHYLQKHKAAQTSRYQGSVISAFGGKVRTGAAINNGIVVLKHCL